MRDHKIFLSLILFSDLFINDRYNRTEVYLINLQLIQNGRNFKHLGSLKLF